ncbi:MAG: tetratricopeptide repeat protein [Puniceicoccaceae bacterium]
MKRIIIALTLAGLCLGVQAQRQQVIEVDSSAAKAYYATQEWQNAFMGYYGVNTDVEPGLPEDPKALEVLGQVKTFLNTGTDADMAAAAGVIEALVKEQQAAGLPSDPMMLQIAGTLLMRQAELAQNPAVQKQTVDRAKRYLEMSVDPNTGFPNFLRAHKNLANLLFRNDQSAQAKVHFIKAIQLGDQDAVSYGMLGAIFMDEGKLISSENALRNSIMLNPEITQFKQLLGNVLLQQERYNEAKEMFAELLMKSPNEANFWMAQANCYIALEEIDEAARNLEIVRFMGKANVPSLMLLGDVYMNKDMVDEATEVYVESINREPTQTNLRQFIGAAETLNNYASYDQAEVIVNLINNKYFGKLQDEDAIRLLTLLSEINISQGQGAEASKNLEALLEKDPFNARALLSLARYYSNLEADDSVTDETQRTIIERRNQQTAIIYYERAQELDEDRDRMRAYIGEAQLRVARKELQEAADLLEEAQSIQYQDNIQAYLTQIRAALQNRR